MKNHISDTVIKNGHIVNARAEFDADILIRNGRIAEIATDIPAGTAGSVIDASGLYVLPGAIDAHTHLQMVMGKTYSADSYESGTRAAACGGVTTVFDYTLQEKGGSILEEIKAREALCAPSACVDYAFHGGISDVNTESLLEMEAAVRYGVPSFKAYMTYDFGINDADLYRVLKRSAEIGALITVHAESDGMIEVNRKDFADRGLSDVWYHYLSRPEAAEEEADFRAIMLARAAGAPIYIVHLASRGGVKLVERARAEGYPVYAETCPHYLEFTNEVYKRSDGIRFICSPPMKGSDSREALWNAVRTGVVSVIATDHCPAQSYEKDWGKDDFTLAPCGCMGIENMYPYMLSAANEGRISFGRAVELCSTNVARIFGCAPQKGCIAPGADADIVLYDPSAEFTVSQSNMHSDIDYTIWEGLKLKGYPVHTMVRGRTVYKDGSFLGEKGFGNFVRRRSMKG